ncbi:TPA: hypothetical protein MC683_005611 [Klebsiella pneumoniae]|nr:hypothetical protein [Klebsiella pneumoniae]HBU7188762.1 hypothetical protein [Klebsiella pneumoniae]
MSSKVISIDRDAAYTIIIADTEIKLCDPMIHLLEFNQHIEAILLVKVD